MTTLNRSLMKCGHQLKQCLSDCKTGQLSDGGRNYWLPALLVLLLNSCTQSATEPKPPQERAPAATVVAPPVPVEDPSQLVWGWQPKALQLTIRADHDLNRYEEQPHALMLCLYQLSSATAWGELAKTPAGVSTLLQCEGFNSSVVQSERLFIQPGEQRQLTMDRLEKGRYVAFIAGYADPTAQRTSPIFSFPVKHATQGLLFWKKDHYWPGELAINLLLTERSLQNIEP
jgi:type VI secretion system VasD/TssJ family lipoprotein